MLCPARAGATTAASAAASAPSCLLPLAAATRFRIARRGSVAPLARRPAAAAPRSRAGLVPRASLLDQILPSAAAGALAATVPMSFTPVTALVGGAVLGIAAVGKLALTGRVLGVSGALKGFVQGNATSWRVLFTLGLAGGALVAHAITPGAFDVLPPSFTVTRAAVGGLLVGLGAALGNGCTSGHGICGNARLSPRSFVYTLTFMAAGMAAATLSQAAVAAGIAPVAAQLAWPTPDVANSGALLVASSLLAMLGLASAAQQLQEKKAVGLATELAAGGLFAFALVYTGMVRPTKVIAFLSPLHAGWDLSLMCVMGGALAVALPGFQAILGRKLLAQPYCETGFAVPPPAAIDAKLVAGGLLFGAGWGLSGMCPGPAVVAAVAQPAPQVLAYVAAMLTGFWLEGVAEVLGKHKPKRAAA